MSQASTDKRNPILLSQPEPSLKRLSPPADDDDDDISIASTTSSPPPDDMMNSENDVSKYRHYQPPEEITVETKIKPTNKGFTMLARLGWKEGQPLGLSEDARLDPIPFQIKRDLTGLGKTNQDIRMIETTVSQRRGMRSERQQKENEDERRAREDIVARKAALESEISSTLKAFYCVLCDKQFKNVAQYDEHTNSYAHHHKARFKDMQSNIRQKSQDIDARKEKERKLEEKQLRKIAAANGIKMAKPTMVATSTDTPSPSVPTNHQADSTPPKRRGWTTISGSGDPRNPPGSGRVTVSSTSVLYDTSGTAGPSPMAVEEPMDSSSDVLPTALTVSPEGRGCVPGSKPDIPSPNGQGDLSTHPGVSQQPQIVHSPLLASPSSVVALQRPQPSSWQQFQKALKRRG